MEESRKEETALEQDKQRSEALDAAAQAGKLLLESGAEIARVEETMARICTHYGVREESFYVLSNGIFLTDEDGEGRCYARTEHIPIHQTRLDRVAAVNQLSREIERGEHGLEEAREILDRIASMPEKGKLWQVLAAGVGSAAFCVLFGGSGRDALSALAAGLGLQLYMVTLGGRLSKVTGTLTGSVLVTAIGCFMQWIGVGEHLNFTIIGSIMPLIPGVAFTVAIRDTANGDYISGFVRMLDALLGFFCIAVGVAFALFVYHSITGGVLL